MSAPDIRVLVVEDSADLAELWNLVFRREGIEGKFCKTGGEAVHAIGAGYSPQVIMTDFFLPDMTGAEMISEIDKSCAGGTKYLVVTGNLHAAKAADFPEGTHFLLKPVDMKELVQKIRAVC